MYMCVVMWDEGGGEISNIVHTLALTASLLGM